MVFVNSAAVRVARSSRREARNRLESQAIDVHFDTEPKGYMLPLTIDSRTTDATETVKAAPPARREVSRLSRRSLQLIAGRAEHGTEGQQAAQLLSLYEAERELKVVSPLLCLVYIAHTPVYRPRLHSARSPSSAFPSPSSTTSTSAVYRSGSTAHGPSKKLPLLASLGSTSPSWRSSTRSSSSPPGAQPLPARAPTREGDTRGASVVSLPFSTDASILVGVVQQPDPPSRGE